MQDVLDRLQSTIRDRKRAGPDGSYTATLFNRGRARIAQKLGEEATETIIAAMGPEPRAIVPEAADLLYHLFVLLADAGLSLDDVRTELVRREGRGGLDEKAARTPAPAPVRDDESGVAIGGLPLSFRPE